jgi:hypothetical protein
MGFRLRDGDTTARLSRHDCGFLFHNCSTALQTSQLRVVTGNRLGVGIA